MDYSLGKAGPTRKSGQILFRVVPNLNSVLSLLEKLDLYISMTFRVCNRIEYVDRKREGGMGVDERGEGE